MNLTNKDLQEDNDALFQMMQDAGLNPKADMKTSPTYLLKKPNHGKRPNWCLQTNLPKADPRGPGKLKNITRSLGTPDLSLALTLRVAKLGEVLEEIERGDISVRVQPRQKRKFRFEPIAPEQSLADSLRNPPEYVVKAREALYRL